MLKKIKKCEILFKSVLFFEPFYEKGQYLLSRPSKGPESCQNIIFPHFVKNLINFKHHT